MNDRNVSTLDTRTATPSADLGGGTTTSRAACRCGTQCQCGAGCACGAACDCGPACSCGTGCGCAN